MSSHIFAGDLNKMNSGLEVVANIYHIKNIGVIEKKIEMVRKISDHPILIYEKELPFQKSTGLETIQTFDKTILLNNTEELKKVLITKNEYRPNLTEPHISKHIETGKLALSNLDYNECFEQIKRQNKDKFETIKKNKKEEIANPPKHYWANDMFKQ